MQENINNVLRFFDLSQKDFDDACLLFRDAYKGREIDNEEVRTIFFIGDPLMFAVAKAELSHVSTNKKLYVIENYRGQSIKVSSATLLFYRAITPSHSALDFNKVTLSLYRLFKKEPPLFKGIDDTDSRLLLISEILGTKTVDTAARELKSYDPQPLLVPPYSQKDFEKWCNTLGICSKKGHSTLEIFARKFSLDSTEFLENLPTHLKVLPLFSPFFNGLCSPKEVLMQKTPHLSQGNLENIVFFLISETLAFLSLENRKSLHGRFSLFFKEKLDIFAFFMNVSPCSLEEKENFINALFSLCEKFFTNKEEWIVFVHSANTALSHYVKDTQSFSSEL